MGEGKTEAGLSKLREAVTLEDALHYDEPPAWMIPARHSLGANLLKAGMAAEAEQVYRDDLKKLPDNGWSLYGLADSLGKQGRADEAAVVDEHGPGESQGLYLSQAGFRKKMPSLQLNPGSPQR